MIDTHTYVVLIIRVRKNDAEEKHLRHDREIEIIQCEEDTTKKNKNALYVWTNIMR